MYERNVRMAARPKPFRRAPVGAIISSSSPMQPSSSSSAGVRKRFTSPIIWEEPSYLPGCSVDGSGEDEVEVEVGVD